MRFHEVISPAEKYALVQPSGNFGDSLILWALRIILAEAGAVYIEPAWDGGGYPVISQEATAVIINGGGNMNQFWKTGVDALAHTLQSVRPGVPVIVAPQSYHFQKHRPFSSYLPDLPGRDLTLFTREEYSLEFVDCMRSRAKVFTDHDLALNLRGEFKVPQSKDYQLVCVRTDRESRGFSVSLQGAVRVSDLSIQAQSFDDFLERIGRASAVHTDRLHVAIAAALMDKDVTLYPNLYHKNQGVYEYSLRHLLNVRFDATGGV